MYGCARTALGVAAITGEPVDFVRGLARHIVYGTEGTVQLLVAVVSALGKGVVLIMESKPIWDFSRSTLPLTKRHILGGSTLHIYIWGLSILDELNLFVYFR